MKVGPDWGTTGTFKPFTAVPSGAQRVSDAHARFMAANLEGRLFSIGGGATALSANTIALTATSTPIVGVWNPSTNDKSLVILQASLQVYINTLTTPVGSGPFAWASSVGNTAISTGSTPYCRKTMVAVGSAAKGFPGGVALTGLTNNVVLFAGAHFQNTTSLTHGTVTAVTTQFSIGGVQNFDGGLIVPPGGVLSLINTTSTTTCSVAAELVWEEVPILP